MIGLTEQPGGPMKSVQTQQVAVIRAIRLPEVCGLIGASRATVWRLVNRDASFPRPFKLSPAITAWDFSEVLNWLAIKKTERGAR